MRLPVLTCIGDTFASRVAASLLERANLPELVMHSLHEYEQKALELAQNVEKLAQIKQKLDVRKLFDAAQFARDLEQQYRHIWKQQAIWNTSLMIK